MGVHVILYDKDGSSRDDRRDLGSWKQIFDIVTKRRDRLQKENPSMRATIFIYNDLNDVKKFYENDDAKLKLIIKKKLSQSRHEIQSVKLSALLNKISQSQSQPGHILTFSDLTSVIEWNESTMQSNIRPMALISPNSLIQPTTKYTPQLEHLVIAKMTGSWDKNHCLRWKAESLRLAFILLEI